MAAGQRSGDQEDLPLWFLVDCIFATFKYYEIKIKARKSFIFFWILNFSWEIQNNRFKGGTKIRNLATNNVFSSRRFILRSNGIWYIAFVYRIIDCVYFFFASSAKRAFSACFNASIFCFLKAISRNFNVRTIHNWKLICANTYLLQILHLS